VTRALAVAPQLVSDQIGGSWYWVGALFNAVR